MILLQKGALRARVASGPVDLAASRALRRRVFPGDRPDGDPFDAICRHVLIEDAGGALRGSFRLLSLGSGSHIGRSYSARFYDLGALGQMAAPMLEIGRFCIDPAVRDPNVLRVAWGAITRLVDAERVALLFGCASFPGTDAAAHGDALAHLATHHIAPARLSPRVRAAETVPLVPTGPVAQARAMAAIPPLLRSYLGMGGWVSDHAVIDRTMGTMHVFCGVEIAAIPPARARLLRAIAGAAPAP